jgi:hypothetical protein
MFKNHLRDKIVPTPEAESARLLSNLIDSISISKEGMCQSERGFGVDTREEMRMEKNTLAACFPGVQRGKALTCYVGVSGPLADKSLKGRWTIWPSEWMPAFVGANRSSPQTPEHNRPLLECSVGMRMY